MKASLTTTPQRMPRSTTAPVRVRPRPSDRGLRVQLAEVLSDSPAATRAPGHHLSRMAPFPTVDHPVSRMCSLMPAPRACPFGGACHTCPMQVQAKSGASPSADGHASGYREPDPRGKQLQEAGVEAASLSIAMPIVQRSCPRCDEDDEQLLQSKDSLEQAPPVARGSAMPSIVEAGLGSPGRPLEQATRAFMEPRFGHDFAAVRVHADAQAAASARAVNALAYTVGSDIVFAAAQYQPASAAGRRLIAHELVHVVQQGGTVRRAPEAVPTHQDEPAEIEARHFAEGVSAAEESEVTGEPAAPSFTPVAPGWLSRTIAYDADCQPHQEEVRGNVSRAQGSAARWARAAVAALAVPEDAGSLLRRHFGVEATNTAAVAQIRGVFESIAGYLDADAFTYHCRPDSDSRCQAADGEEYAGFAYPGGFDIYFCDPYPYQNFFGHKSLIATLLHEAAHAHDASFNNDTYESNSAYPGPNPMTNADCYSSFARDAALGIGSFAVDLSLGSLVSAEPQFYISVGVAGDIGGPALDVINLRMGAHLAFMPGTGSQPARGLDVVDIGLRINPVGQRVYVDLATGAFFGVNFTDSELMAGIANRLSAGYRGERLDLGLDLSHFYDFVSDEHLVIVGVRGGVRF